MTTDGFSGPGWSHAGQAIESDNGGEISNRGGNHSSSTRSPAVAVMAVDQGGEQKENERKNHGKTERKRVMG